MVSVLIGMTISELSATGLKIAMVDIQAVTAQLPQMAAIVQRVEDEFREQIEVVKKLQADAKFNYDKLQREGATLSDLQAEQLKRALTEQQESLASKSTPLQTEMVRRGAELQNEILAKVEQVIEEVSNDGGYDFVFHKSSLVYTPHKHVDISQQVINKARTR